MWKLEEAGIDHLASRCQAVLPVSVPRSRTRTVTAQHRPARGLQVHFRADSFLCVLLPAPGVCAPCRRHGLARRARPSLRQWVWTWVGEEGESRMCLLPLLPLPRFFPPLNARCHLFAASHVSIIACQVLWPGFGGPAEARVKEQGHDERGHLGV